MIKKRLCRELELSSNFSHSLGSDFIAGCGLAAGDDPVECFIVNQRDPGETRVLMNRCFSLIQVFKSMDTLREHMCNK